MAKKDFINGSKVLEEIATATADAQENAETQETPKTRKTRKTYSAQETEEFLNTMQTAGHKGVKLPRINLAFAPDLYDYVKTMSRAAGLTYTEFINGIMRQHMEEHADTYKQAVKFRNSL